MSGFSASQLVSQLLDRIVLDIGLTEMQKSLMAQKIGNVERCLIDGADEHLQLLDLGHYFASLF